MTLTEPGSLQHQTLMAIVGILAVYFVENQGAEGAGALQAIARRLYNAGFRQVGTPIDDHQNRRIERLESRVDRIEGWMGPLGRLP